jgi:hypothetical protein
VVRLSGELLALVEIHFGSGREGIERAVWAAVSGKRNLDSVSLEAYILTGRREWPKEGQ